LAAPIMDIRYPFYNQLEKHFHFTEDALRELLNIADELERLSTSRPLEPVTQDRSVQTCGSLRPTCELALRGAAGDMTADENGEGRGFREGLAINKPFECRSAVLLLPSFRPMPEGYIRL
jgi:hypothetical protein